MPKYDEKLLVSWKGPKSKSNYFVGLLSKNYTSRGLNYKFIYNREIVLQAEEEGFMPFVGLKDLNKEYSSDKLFSVFERRLPNQSRNIFKKFIEDYDLQTSNTVTWEYLKITKGRTATDNISFLEPVYIEKDKLSYNGEIAGWSFTRINNTNLKVRDQLILRNDENNIEDKQAVEIINPENENELVGFIQKPFNKVFFSLLKKGYSLSGYIASIDANDYRPTIAIEKKICMEDIDTNDLEYLIHFK
ncbi:HIRAN domain-containing protein [Ureibacillus chungkukjangi]|uniref:HIRAN domain-containing protein n=1 Tax=Ureibacillus chungkukjangi TaxID=1202712 RepID=UPI00203AAF69|nr:HIRAN domain-containing protein [Ureibacillus chungkukjangi]MCM3389223.1 HIRAN domain-containing protein [Ureibacillus chungkukjangi]